ncbi:MAG TPA: TPM domain-containing protein [Syntrophales bacterium]|nr:TPM domain-containing protein [Syntrophales bacterium]HOX93942.1 TPM domain-containing protein [Syntrophales bacterium]HPI56113.1 TPM domain-containing protein [Syntrophales bacterium]HPN23997.1 TPM domain-containing protein [Syntrophales bacterium]HQM28276.1 TPM domain-containing protein [Syntrophales bacterium]
MTLPFKKWTFFVISLILCLVISAGNLVAEKFPSPTGAVNDFAGVIPPEQRAAMSSLAQEVLEKTGTAVVVATFRTVGDNDPDEYANRLYEKWGIGRKGEDKGVLIFLALQERRVRIETGYGVEGIITDGMAGEILDRHAMPSLRAGDYGKGLYNAMFAVSDLLARNANVTLTGAPRPQVPAVREVPITLHPLTVIILLLILTLLLSTRSGRRLLALLLLSSMNGRGGRYGGGGFGGFGGGFGGFGGGSSGGGGAGRSF